MEDFPDEKDFEYISLITIGVEKIRSSDIDPCLKLSMIQSWMNMADVLGVEYIYE